MKIQSVQRVTSKGCTKRVERSNWLGVVAKLFTVVWVIGSLSGCRTETRLFEEELTPYGSVKLTEGDLLAITFAGSPDLNTSQRIRRDGKIDLKLVGEITAVGKTPAELEKEILDLYKDQLVLKQVSVSLQTTSYPVFVTGSVTHPGEVLADKPISALEAIMKAGGFDAAKANIRRVVVLRLEEGKTKRYVLNLKRLFDGKTDRLFYLRPSDIVWVPEKTF